jgi:Helicase associated domain
LAIGPKLPRPSSTLPDRRRRLEALPGWSWNAVDDKWEEGFAHLKDFSEREQHCRVPKGHKTQIGYPLGNWVGTQRLVTKDPGWDAALPGFGVKVTPKGRKVFLVRLAGAGSRLRKYTIGPVWTRHPADGQGPGAKDLCGGATASSPLLDRVRRAEPRL